MTVNQGGWSANVAGLRPLAADLLAERGVTDYVKVGNLVAVALGLRPLSLTYLPAEMPGGSRLGEAIDQYFVEHYAPPPAGLGSLLRRRQGPARDQEAALLAKRKTLDEAYQKVVAESPVYVAHLYWLDRLGLDQYQVKRRPTLREMYVYRDRAVRAKLLDLETIAGEARERAAGARGQGQDQSLLEYVYAGEFEPRYLQGLGELLGYPGCCVEAYAKDRVGGQNVEQRAWEQVRDYHVDNRPVDVRAYFLKDFFPCTPDCPQAADRGEEYQQASAELHPELGELYTGVLWSNFELVQSYPQLIAKHRQRLEQSRRPGQPGQ